MGKNKKKIIISTLVVIFAVFGVYVMIKSIIDCINTYKTFFAFRLSQKGTQWYNKDLRTVWIPQLIQSALWLIFSIVAEAITIIFSVFLIQDKINIVLTNSVFSKEEYERKKQERKQQKQQEKIKKLERKIQAVRDDKE